MNSLQLSYAFGLIQSPLEYKQNKWTCVDDVFSETVKNVKFDILKIGTWNLYGKVLWYDVSHKGTFNKIACFLGVFSLFF